MGNVHPPILRNFKKQKARFVLASKNCSMSMENVRSIRSIANSDSYCGTNVEWRAMPKGWVKHSKEFPNCEKSSGAKFRFPVTEKISINRSNVPAGWLIFLSLPS